MFEKAHVNTQNVTAASSKKLEINKLCHHFFYNTGKYEVDAIKMPCSYT